MKKTTTLCLGTVIALTVSVFFFGCAERKAMEPMGSKVEIMHNEDSAMGGMHDKTKMKEMSGTMKEDKSMGDMNAKCMKKEMVSPMEEKKM
jgi:hypothetical protein